MTSKSKQKIDLELNLGNDSIVISRNKYESVKKILSQLHESLGRVVDLLSTDDESGNLVSSFESLQKNVGSARAELNDFGSEQIIEGVFDGLQMIANDGKVYDVPANYSSKSKLIEGDILKLTVRKDGSFVYKQISPVERRRVVGVLAIDETSGQYYVMSDNKAYKVIPASVTYFKGEVGGEVILLVPKDGTSAWGAIENIIKK